MKNVKKIDTDVLVLGAGPAGVAAAISSARIGRKVILVEKQGFVGGNAITGLCLHTFHTAKLEKIIDGLPGEIIGRLSNIGGTLGPVEITNAHMKTTTPIDHEIMKYLLLKMLKEANVDLLLHSFATDVVVDNNMIKEVIVETKSDRRKISAKIYIDATGDADIAAWAGVPFNKGRESDGLMQAMSLVFKMNNVNLDLALQNIGRATAYKNKEKDGNICMWFAADLDRFEDKVKLEKAFKFIHHQFWGNSFHKGDVNLNITRVIGLDPTDAIGLTEAEIESRIQVYNMSNFLIKNVPGFEDSYVVSTSPFIGVRETRRIIGDYILNADDVINGRRFFDAIARSSYPVDIHDPEGKGTNFVQVKNDFYEIPFRCLLPSNLENLIVTGRCISADSTAMASSRVMIISMSLGQAAGVAAGIAAKDGKGTREINIKEIQHKLREQGAII